MPAGLSGTIEATNPTMAVAVAGLADAAVAPVAAAARGIAITPAAVAGSAALACTVGLATAVVVTNFAQDVVTVAKIVTTAGCSSDTNSVAGLGCAVGAIGAAMRGVAACLAGTSVAPVAVSTRTIAAAPTAVASSATFVKATWQAAVIVETHLARGGIAVVADDAPTCSVDTLVIIVLLGAIGARGAASGVVVVLTGRTTMVGAMVA
jgi:hypothetical protein